MERLRLAWKKRMKHQKYEGMIRELSKLSLEELDKDMETIELLVTKLMIDETGVYTGRCNIITMDDVEMKDTAEQNSSNANIIWTDEQMDTVSMATGEYMDEEHLMEDDRMMTNTAQEEVTMDTLQETLKILFYFMD